MITQCEIAPACDITLYLFCFSCCYWRQCFRRHLQVEVKQNRIQKLDLKLTLIGARMKQYPTHQGFHQLIELKRKGKEQLQNVSQFHEFNSSSVHIIRAIVAHFSRLFVLWVGHCNLSRGI